MNDSIEISPYNINYGNLNREHVELLKKQIEAENDIPIRFYKENGIRYVIDGGHAFSAYTNLKREPPYQIEIKFTTPEDMIALSRHCNVNRIHQAPVSYAESIVKEIELRFGTKREGITTLITTYEQRGGDLSEDVLIQLDDLFSKEPKKVSTFRLEYLPLLKLPEPIKKKVDKGELGISHAGEIVKIKNPEKQKKVAKIVEEDGLSYRDTKDLVERVEKKGESPEYAAYHVFEEKASKHFREAPEHNELKIGRGKEDLPEGIFLYNVWTLLPRRIKGYGDGSFHGVTPVEVCIHTLRAYGKREGICLDSMAGSGTFCDVAKGLGYKIDSSDLRDGIDARHIKKPNGYYDLVFNHFPYWDMVVYNTGKGDLSLLKTRKDFLIAVEEIFRENYRLLKENGYYCVMIGDQRKERTTSWLTIDFPKIAEKIGFVTYDNAYIITLDTEHISSGLAEYRAKEFGYMKPAVDWYLVFKKISKN